MKLIFESLNIEKGTLNESVIGAIILTGIAVNIARKMLGGKNKINKSTENNKEKFLIGLQKIDKLPIDYSVKPGNGNKFKQGQLSELMYRNVSNMNKIKEYSKKNCKSVSDYISNKDNIDNKIENECKKFEKSGVILMTIGKDAVIYDSSKLYYIDYISSEVYPITWERILSYNWESAYKTLKYRKII